MRLLRLALLASMPVGALCMLGAASAAQSGDQPAGRGSTRPVGGQVSAAYTGCLARAGASTVQRGMCAQAELSRQDERLNRAYQALRAALAGSGIPSTQGETADQRTLREEERAWLADRDQVCKLNHDTVDNACLVEREAARADELEARLRQKP